MRRLLFFVLVLSLVLIPLSTGRVIEVDCARFNGDPDSCREVGCTVNQNNVQQCLGTGEREIPDQTCSDFTTANECGSGEGCTWENSFCTGDGLIRVDGSFPEMGGEGQDLFVDDTNGFLYTYALGVGPNDDDLDQGPGCDVDSEPIYFGILDQQVQNNQLMVDYGTETSSTSCRWEELPITGQKRKN